MHGKGGAALFCVGCGGVDQADTLSRALYFVLYLVDAPGPGVLLGLSGRRLTRRTGRPYEHLTGDCRGCFCFLFARGPATLGCMYYYCMLYESHRHTQSAKSMLLVAESRVRRVWLIPSARWKEED